MGFYNNVEIQKASGQSIFPKIEKLISSTGSDDKESQMKSFIDSRLGELSPDAPTILSMTSQMKKTYAGFINPESEIKPTIIHKGIKINDNQIYASLLESFFCFKENPAWQNSDENERKLALNAVQLAIDTYFGYETEDAFAKRSQFYSDHTPDWNSEAEQKSIDLIEMRGKGIAQCLEKAAVAQNLLRFLGYDSEIILSQCSADGEEKTNHAYNVVKIKENRYIYDPTNPVIVERPDGSTYPTAVNYPLTENQYNSLTAGHPIEIIHNDLKVENGSFSKKSDIKWVYGGIGD